VTALFRLGYHLQANGLISESFGPLPHSVWKMWHLQIQDLLAPSLRRTTSASALVYRRPSCPLRPRDDHTNLLLKVYGCLRASCGKQVARILLRFLPRAPCTQYGVFLLVAKCAFYLMSLRASLKPYCMNH